MRFENSVELNMWLKDVFMQKSPTPLTQSEVKKGEVYMSIRKNSYIARLIYIDDIRSMLYLDGGEEVKWWERGIGDIISSMEKLERRLHPSSQYLERYSMEYIWMEYQDEIWDARRGRLSHLLAEYYLYPFNRDTLQYFLNWNINPLEVKE